MSGFIEGEARTQATLLLEILDDYITEDNAVRVTSTLYLSYENVFIQRFRETSSEVFSKNVSPHNNDDDRFEPFRLFLGDTMATGLANKNRFRVFTHVWVACRLYALVMI